MAGYIIICHYFVGYHLLFYRWQLIIPDEHKFKIKVTNRFFSLQKYTFSSQNIGECYWKVFSVLVRGLAS